MNPMDNTPPVPPEPPAESSCCETGCGDQCVWEIYNSAMRAYREELAMWQSLQDDEPSSSTLD